VELREPRRHTTERWTDPPPSCTFALADGASVHLEEPRGRLWVARLDVPAPVLTWLAVHGRPIRYGYVDRPWPLSAYQNVYV